MTGSGVVTIFVYKRLTRNREIGNTPVWVLPNIWKLGRVKDTKFGTNVSDKNLLKLQNGRVAALTVSELLRENQQGVKLPPPPHPVQIRVDKKSLKNTNMSKSKYYVTMAIRFSQ